MAKITVNNKTKIFKNKSWMCTFMAVLAICMLCFMVYVLMFNSDRSDIADICIFFAIAIIATSAYAVYLSRFRIIIEADKDYLLYRSNFREEKVYYKDIVDIRYKRDSGTGPSTWAIWFETDNKIYKTMSLMTDQKEFEKLLKQQISKYKAKPERKKK